MDYNKLLPNNYAKDNQQSLKLLMCIDLTNCSERARFIYCSMAIFFFYIVYGYLQELIFTLDGFRSHGWYLTLIQFGYYTLFGYIECKLCGIYRRIPWSIYMGLALLTLGTMGFSNSSLGYLNYPTQVIFKSCKLIPVLIGGILIQQKQYGILDFGAAGLLCAGLVMFTLADSMISPRFSITGVIIISCALLCDAVIGNVQEKAIKQYKASNTEVVLYSYSLGFVYLFVILLMTGELKFGALFCSNHPVETYGYALLFSLSGYLGIQIVLTLVRSNGAFVAATVTTCRKAVTIIISFIFFYKPFTIHYVWSGLLVALGIYLNIYSKQRDSNVKYDKATLWIIIKRWCWRHSQVQKQLMMNV